MDSNSDSSSDSSSDCDFDHLLSEYNTLTLPDLEKLRDEGLGGIGSSAKHLHKERVHVRTYGKAAIRTRPLFQLISATVQPTNGKPLRLYGDIKLNFTHDGRHFGKDVISVSRCLYTRDHANVDVFDTTRSLSLNSPDSLYYPYHAYLPLEHKVDFNLFDGESVFLNESIFLMESDDEKDQLRSLSIPGYEGILSISYMAIPFGVYCCTYVYFSTRKGARKYIDLNGKITATYGNNSSAEFTLFYKPSEEFEHVNMNQNLELSSCWICVPAYSTLIVHLDLSEFGTGVKILNNKVELVPEKGWMSGDSILLDDMDIGVGAYWYSAPPIEREDDEEDGENDDMDTDGDDEAPSDEIEDMGSEENKYEETLPLQTLPLQSSHDRPPSMTWSLRPHKVNPWPSPGLEIFSIVIGLEKLESAKIYGSISYSSDGREVYIFKRGEEDALTISNHVKSTPIPDGSRGYADDDELEMKLDIKDLEGRFAVKGYAKFDGETLESERWNDKQLCYVIQGVHGFAAIHCSLFQDALEASIQVSVKLNKGSVGVHGSLIAEYDSFKYASRYDKEYYRMILFRNTEEDPIPSTGHDLIVPLSRSTFTVPVHSSLVIHADLSVGDPPHHILLGSTKIMTRDTHKIIETNGGAISIRIKWYEIK